MSIYVYSVAGAVILLAAATAALRLRGVAAVERVLRKIALFLLRRGLFRVPLTKDLVRLNLLRIASGLILLHRSLYTADFVFDGPDSLLVKLACGAVILLAALFTVGLATPVVALTLLLLNVMILDALMRTMTLGSDVLSMLLLTFVLLPAGTALSLDAVIARRGWPGARLIRVIYAVAGPPTLLRAVISRTACLVSYSLLCLYSVTLHFGEAFWLSGDVGLIVLSSSYFNRYYPFFREVLADHAPAVWLARFAMWGMLVWYLSFGLFTLIGGLFRRFVIVWAAMFFFVSTFVLQLGWLGYYEFVLLLLLFWDRAFLNVGGRRSLDVLYDDRCNLCDRTVRFLMLVDLFKVAELRPLSRNEDLRQRLGVSRDAALKDLYGFDSRSGRTYHGYEFYLEISRRLLVIVPFFPLLLLGRVLGIGPMIYRIIADRRTRWFGVCERPAPVSSRAPGTGPLLSGRTNPWPRAYFAGFVAVYSALAVTFLANLPPTPWHRSASFVSQLAHVFALVPINVFNHQDMKMNEHWFTVRAVYADRTERLIPFAGLDGERLEWHKSDRVYYGNSVLWRRLANRRDDICFVRSDAAPVREIVAWDRRRDRRPVDRYIVTYYVQPPPRISTVHPYFAIDDVRATCTATFNARGRFVSLDRPS